MKESAFLSRLENLKYRGEDTGYRYLGSAEVCKHTFTFPNKDGNGFFADNILNKGEYGSIEDFCSSCKDKDTCNIVKDSYEDFSNCDNFGGLDQDIVQSVVYYNEKLNSAIVFNVFADFVCDNYGFENIVDLIEDIYSGVNSTYSHINSVESELCEELQDFEDVLKEKDNVIYIEYANSCVITNYFNLHYCSLKDVHIKSVISILNLIEETI